MRRKQLVRIKTKLMKLLPRNIPGQRSPLSAFLFSNALDILAKAVKQEKESLV